MNYNIYTYSIYLILSAWIVIIVGQSLYKNGRPFVLDAFDHNEPIADAVNLSLLIGYYLLNIGACIIQVKNWGEINTIATMIEHIAQKLSEVCLLLGVMHYFNLLWLWVVKKMLLKNELETNKS